MSDLARKDIVKRLIHLDKQLTAKYKNKKRKFDLIIVGGAALMLKYKLERYTDDIDSLKLEEELNKYLRENYDIFRINDRANGVILINPDYKKRLKKLQIDYSFNVLEIFVLNDYDLIISKIGRGYQKDVDDIISSGVLDNIDIEKLEKLMIEAVNYYPVAPEKKRKDWEFFKKNYLNE